jgi:hypothetical protein
MHRPEGFFSAMMGVERQPSGRFFSDILKTNFRHCEESACLDEAISYLIL